MEQRFMEQYIALGGKEKFIELKQTLIQEVNELNIPGMSIIDELYTLEGSFVNLEYMLPSGKKTKFLDDNSVYLGNQVECEFGEERCYGVVAGLDFLLVCEYGEDGVNPELVVYKRR
ncbi:MAG: DUF3795 domain-containing protein [Agathobacter sp.]|nr:DUF3795 domain-containing protein [Agathobacter sp.]